MFDITENLILDYSTDSRVFAKAKSYYRSNSIKALDYDEENHRFNGIVSGTKNYRVEVDFYGDGTLHEATCTCPAYRKYRGYCKHIGAVLFGIKERIEIGEFDSLKDEKLTQKLLDSFQSNYTQNKKELNLEINYEFEYDLYRHLRPSSYFSIRMGESRLYKVRDVRKLLQSIEKNEELYYGKQFTFDPYRHKFKDEDKELIEFIMELYENQEFIETRNYGFQSHSLFKDGKIYLAPTSARRFFNIIQDRTFDGKILGYSYKNINIINEDPPIDMLLTKKDKDLVLEVEYKDSIIPLDSRGEYFFLEGNIYRLTEKGRDSFLPLYNTVINDDANRIKIPKEYSERFISEIYPHIKNIGRVKIDKRVEDSIYNVDLRTDVYLDKRDEEIVAKINFVYDDIIINPFSSNEKKVERDDVILLRDVDKENNILGFFEELEFKVKENTVYLNDEDKIFNFLLDGINRLQEIGDIYYSDAFKRIQIKDRSSFIGGVKLNSESDMLEFNFKIDGISNSEIGDVFKALNEKKKYYKLKDGSFLPLAMEELKEMSDLIMDLDLTKDDLEKDTINIPKFRGLYLNDRVKESKLGFIKRDLRLKELVQNIKEPQDIDFEIPKALDKVLRGYQGFGFKWLKVLSQYGLGGILADDMGLGKTLQVLTFLKSEKKERGSKPSLIVAPTSLVYNWLSEIEKFTPDLSTLIISGNKDERLENIETINQYDIVITSYPLIRRDIDFYDKFSFRYCILDEAQHIKNPMSQNAKSVKSIKAKNYFALTGTPIENSLTELWSIFDFIMPGYLLSHNRFKKDFEKPIVKDQDSKALDKLRRHISPFILRRLKRDVLKELPEKIEHRVVVELTNEQKKVYLAYLKKIKGEIEEEIKEKGFQRSHIKILSGLTRLRQICCDPSLFIEDFNGESGKLLLLEEIIDDALQSEHRILLFSQFTSMLSIIKNILNEKNIPYKYLDGSTPSKDRGKIVKEFNRGDGDIFLISLKAGGTGLNLTGADTVIHFDPWWNPAVEEQATDRAYRIGQKNSVHVMKLITKGTIEEKIFKLQEKKREMIDAVIKPGENLVSKMTEEEIRDLFNI